MSNPLNLLPNRKYRVVKPFTDYDKRIHPEGETWTFLYTRFLPYEDGLTLHVQLEDATTEAVCRLQWRVEEQAGIIENFTEYVTLCS